MAIRFMKDGRKKPFHVYYDHPYTGKRVTEPFKEEGEAKQRNAQLKIPVKYERETFLPTDHSQDHDGEPTVDDVLFMYLRTWPPGRRVGLRRIEHEDHPVPSSLCPSGHRSFAGATTDQGAYARGRSGTP